MTIKQLDNEQKKCPVETAINIISGKWKALILIHLMKKMRRFNELRRLMPNISQRMLTNQLRDLELDGLVNRKIYAEVPPRVEYSLTERGYAVRSVLVELKRLGENAQVDNIAQVDTAENSMDPDCDCHVCLKEMPNVGGNTGCLK